MKKRFYRTANAYRAKHLGGGGGLFSSFGRLMAALVAFVVVLLLILRLVAPGALTAAAVPLWRTGASLDRALGERFSLSSRAQLSRERDQLRSENETLKNQNAVLSVRAADLERLLGGRTETGRGILAGVLVHPPLSPYDTIVVDQGSEAGVSVGSVAYGPGGVPAGTVSEVYAHAARILLYSSPGRMNDGWVGANRIPLKLKGAGAGAFEVTVPGTAGAQMGDQVFVAGPGALPIGAVAEILTDPSSPSVGLRIKPVVNPFSLTWVTISPAAALQP